MKKIFVILLLLYGCVGGYPQRVISFQQTDSICHVTIQSSSVMADTSLLKIVKSAVVDPGLSYPSDVLPFLEPTSLID